MTTGRAAPGTRRILTPQERRQRNREEMIAGILDASRAVMREEGVAALNLQEVARRVGVRAPSLYEYFPSKMAIYDAVFRLGTRLYAERLRQVMEAHQSFWDRLRGFYEVTITFASENPELFQLCFERPVLGFVPSDASFEESRRLLFPLGESLVDDARAVGEIDPALDADRARDLVIAVGHGLAASHLANEPQLPIGEGRFGVLVPAAVELFRSSWSPRRTKADPNGQ